MAQFQSGADTTHIGGLAHVRRTMLVLDHLDGVELSEGIALSVAGAHFGDAFEQQCKDAEGDVSTDAVGAPMEDGSGS